MIQNYTISLVLPCFNEEEGLKKLFEKVPEQIDQIIVVDNNSSDGTSKVAHTHGARIERENVKGYGAAMKRGIYSSESDIIITMDGDDTYPVDLCPQIVQYLLENELEFISCNRFPLMEKQSMNLMNKIGNLVLTITSRMLFRVSFKDSQSGMWVFRRSILEKIQLENDGMPLSQEIKLKAILAGLAFEEYHIPYADRVGISKLNRFVDGFDNLSHLFKLRFSKSKK